MADELKSVSKRLVLSYVLDWIVIMFVLLQHILVHESDIPPE
jgi:hypothetical protein